MFVFSGAVIFVERFRGMGFCLVSNERVREYDGLRFLSEGIRGFLGSNGWGLFSQSGRGVRES